MTNREQVLKILQGEKPDKVPWFGDLDYWAISLVANGIKPGMSVPDEEFDRHVKAVLSVMRENPRYVLGVADQVPPDGLEYRVKRVRELVDQYGVYE